MSVLGKILQVSNFWKILEAVNGPWITNTSGVPCKHFIIQNVQWWVNALVHTFIFHQLCTVHTVAYHCSVWIKASAECLNVVRLSWFGQCVLASESGASRTYGFTYEPPPSLASSRLSAHLFPSPPCLRASLNFSSPKMHASSLSVSLFSFASLFPHLHLSKDYVWVQWC